MADEEKIDKEKFNPHNYHSRIFLDFDIQEHFGYAIGRTVFRYYDPLHFFVEDNSNISVYLTNDKNVKNFEIFGDDLLVNIDDFISFCDNIGYSKKDKGRVKAYFGQHLGLSKINSTEEEKSKFIRLNATEKDFIQALQTFSNDSRARLVEAILI